MGEFQEGAVKLTKEDQKIQEQEKRKQDRIKELTGEKFFSEWEGLKKSLLQFRERFWEMRDELKKQQNWKDWITEGSEKGEVNHFGEVITIHEAIRRMNEAKGEHISPHNKERLRHVIRNVNDFCEKYGLDYEVTEKTYMDADEISKEIEKAYYAKMWMVQNDIEGLGPHLLA